MTRPPRPWPASPRPTEAQQGQRRPSEPRPADARRRGGRRRRGGSRPPWTSGDRETSTTEDERRRTSTDGDGAGGRRREPPTRRCAGRRPAGRTVTGGPPRARGRGGCGLPGAAARHRRPGRRHRRRRRRGPRGRGHRGLRGGPGVPRRLVGPDGKVLDALQELTRLAVQAATGERSRLMLDVAGHRAERRSRAGGAGADGDRAGRSRPVRSRQWTR